MTRIITCSDCGRDRSHKAQGKCASCYQRDYRASQGPRTVQLCKCGCGLIPPVGSQGRPRTFMPGHREIFLERQAIENFWAKIDMGHPNECWPWSGSLNEKGYGVVSWHDRPSRAHRVAYLLKVEPIADSLTLDHLCHKRGSDCPGGLRCPHRRCCNPAHLEPVPAVVNTMRGMGTGALNALKVECIHGHLFTEANTRIRKDGKRDCRECHHEDNIKTTEKRRAEARRRGEKVA